MINHIDVSSVLRRTVCDLFSNLVTRSTGEAVRTEIENLLADRDSPTITVIDFSHVGLLDFSCADEVIAKLLLRYLDEPTRVGAFFVVRGVRDAHLDAIESVLERYSLALVVEDEAGVPRLVGTVTEPERDAWQAVARVGRLAPGELARVLGREPSEAQLLLEKLLERRLVMRLEGRYVALGAPV